MHREGFEPSSVATSHLECDSLDRSDICARYSHSSYPLLMQKVINLHQQNQY